MVKRQELKKRNSKILINQKAKGDISKISPLIFFYSTLALLKITIQI
jgi:hypothetical protein